MKRAYWTNLTFTLAVSLGLGVASLSPALSRLDGLSTDALFWLRHKVFGPVHDPESSRVAVIAIDEETYRRPPFRDVPKAMWTPQIARVIRATLDAGATVVGQDIVLPTSVEPYLPGFDRDYLLTLREGSRDERLVLGQIQHSAEPITPYRGHLFAVGGGENLRIVNLFREQDGIIRRIPISFTRVEPNGGTTREASFAVELAARALGVKPRFDSDGELVLGDIRLTGDPTRGMPVNFAGGGRALPVYSLADLSACAGAGEHDFFQRAFSGKIVILGAALDVEDRKLTSARYVTSSDGTWFAERCKLPVMSELYDPEIVRDTIPAAFIFATAINNILRGEMLSEPSAIGALLIVAAAAFAASWMSLYTPLMLGLAALGVGSMIWISTATALFRQELVVPLIDPLAGAIAAFAITTGYRLAVTDRARRQVQLAFSYYLPPAIVDRMIKDERLPELGGETREVTIFMSDIAAFTSVCEGLSPEETVRLMNLYFNAASETIEGFDGCVSQYVGDAIVAIFGAPLDDPDHAKHAVEAALSCRRVVAELAPAVPLHKRRRLHVRTGIATGPALIGNIGSARRFNYSAMGDTVNLAARLESANKVYGTDILIGETTREQLGGDIPVRPLERVRVQGRDQPILLYEPIGTSGQVSTGQVERIRTFSEAARLRDDHDFSAARRLLEPLKNEPPVRVLIEHLCHWERSPPPRHEKPVFNLPHK